MDIKIREIQIDPTNPFEHDTLEREGEIQNLTNLLLNIKTPIVFSINGKWGSGKTTFIQMWENYLKNNNVFCINFNAWETDFSTDPLIAFLGEMNERLKSIVENNSEKNALWENTKKIGGHLSKRAIPVLVKLATAGIVDTDDIIETEAKKLSENLANDAVDHFSKTKDLIIDFKDNLKNTLSELSNEDQPYNKQIVIFVDELDRCRPTYALELLERIKHFLDIEGLVFVLSLDKKQLGHSIKAVYGQNFDSQNYLRRFIDIEYVLKKPNKANYITSLFEQLNLNSFFSSRESIDDFRYEEISLQKTFTLLSDMFDLSLREIEQYASKIYLFILSTETNTHIYAPLIPILLIIKEKNNKLYEKYAYGDSNGDDVIKYLRDFIATEKRIRTLEFARIEGFILNAKRDYNSDIISNTILEHQATTDDPNSDQTAASYSQRVINITDEPITWGDNIDFEYLLSRVELLNSFNIPSQDE